MNKMNLTAMLEIKHPIIQAPMAGVTTPEFVAASAEAGDSRFNWAGYLSADETRKFIREVKKSYREAICGEFVCSGKGESESRAIAGSV